MKKPRRTSRKKRQSTRTQATTDSIKQGTNFPLDPPLPDPEEPTKNLRRAMRDPESFGETLRAQLSSLWLAALHAPSQTVPDDAFHAISPHLWRDARLELLRTAIHACDHLSYFDDDDFKDIAPFARGWPIVLAATMERARDWREAKAKIKRLQVGLKHHSRIIRPSTGSVGEFVDFWIWRSMPELRQPGVTAEDLAKLPQRAMGELARWCSKGLKEVTTKGEWITFGNEWQDHPTVFDVFGKYQDRSKKKWDEWPRWQKRDFVRDKFEGAARTLRDRLARFGRI
jgi:hypothetical protein